MTDVQIALGDGEPRDVAVARSGDRATVWINGVPCDTTSTSAAGATVVEIEGRRESVYAVTDRDTIYVHAFGRSWTLTVTDPVESRQRGGASSDAATAPMPGTLVSVRTEPGAEVAEGQIVAVIESMKMQTEIAAPRDGVVDRVLVEIGGSFDGGASLVALVPLDTEAADEPTDQTEV